MLRSHRGYDPGALQASRQFATALLVDCPGPIEKCDDWITSRTTRLLVDLNRSSDSSTIFSEFTRSLDDLARATLINKFHRPYRERVRSRIASHIAEGKRVIHLSVHTFVPRLAGVWRPVDVGLLFDPDRRFEKTLCDHWAAAIQRESPTLRVHANQPYAGVDDGLTTWLRTCFHASDYMGIELEINSRFYKRDAVVQHKIVSKMLAGWSTARDSI